MNLCFTLIFILVKDSPRLNLGRVITGDARAAGGGRRGDDHRVQGVVRPPLLGRDDHPSPGKQQAPMATHAKN